jgi:hypothetical protein
MNREISEGFSLEVRNTVLPIRDALVAAGWTFGELNWDSKGLDRKLAFSAKSPTGASLYIACHESNLAERLQSLLDGRDDTLWR